MNKDNKSFSVGLASYGHTIKNNFPVMLESSIDDSINIIKVGEKVPKIVKGHIINTCLDKNDHPVSKVKLSFIRMNNNFFSAEAVDTNALIYESDAELRENTILNDTPNNIIYDYCYTDNNGNYIAYLEPGEYKARVDSPHQYYYFNFSVDDGLYNYYEYALNANIKKKIDDTIQIYGTDKVQITGCLFNEYNQPFIGEIVISQNNNLIMRIKTKSDGKYNFLLNYGTYDIRLRSPKQSVQIFYNFKFKKNKGFFTELLKHNIKGMSQEVIDNLIANNQIPSNLLAYNWTDHTR